MNEINLLYARNTIARKDPVVRQELVFLLLVDNLAFEKQVDVQWAGEDGVWRTLPASHHQTIDQDREYWLARASFELGANQSLPGNVEFAVRYRVAGAEYWDNHGGTNYSLEADSGILLADDRPLLNVEFDGQIADRQSVIPVVVAVDRRLEARKVTVHWSDDRWQTTRQAACRSRRNYWDGEYASNARNPNQYGCQVWEAALPVGEAYRVDYRISCEAPRPVADDDNFGRHHFARRRPLAVLILNLHCCQEENQDQKLSQIARAIDELDVDIVCLQEVAELWNGGRGDWQTNTARIINARLRSPYHLVTDWSHLGFERFREGVAVLSRHPVERHEARYVSESRDPYSIHSRKVVMARVLVPWLGPINVFSSHLSWWEDGFAEQFANLRAWAADQHGREVRASLLCGDFNIKAGARGYQLVAASTEYEDQYLAVRSPQTFARVFASGEAGWEALLDDDQRIDYVFLRTGSDLRAISARELFTADDYGTVSDHPGYLVTFEPR